MTSTATPHQEDLMPTASAYIGENVGGFTMAAPHHAGGSQDSFYPTNEDELPNLTPLDLVQHGRLYLLADGVSLCADGREASRLAVSTAARHYYFPNKAYPNTNAGRKQRLEDAIWNAHLTVANWEEKYFCWRAEAHEDGIAHYFKKEQLPSLAPPRCPICHKVLVGLQTTFIAALVRGQYLTLVGIGDSSALRVPAEQKYPIEWIHSPYEDQFVGMPSLSRQSIIAQDFILRPDERVLLVSDGTMRVLQGLHTDEEWHGYLRSRLLNRDLTHEVPNLMQDLNSWRITRPHQRKLQDDLTLLAIAVPSESQQESAHKEAVDAFENLKELRAETNPLPPHYYNDFLQKAETALAHTNQIELWRTYGQGHHERALSLLNERGTTNDLEVWEALRASARVTVQTIPWLNAYTQTNRLRTWREGQVNPFEVDRSVHTSVINDLSNVNIAAETPRIAHSINDTILYVARQFRANGRTFEADQYQKLADILSGAKSVNGATADVPFAISPESLPPTTEENTQVLEAQIAIAIAERDWVAAQELISQLNKLRGVPDGVQDTESVDTLLMKRSSPQPAPLTGAYETTQVPATGWENNNHVQTTDGLQTQHVAGRSPMGMVREAVKLLFPANPNDRDIEKGVERLEDALRMSPDSAILKEDWQALWHNPAHSFGLVPNDYNQAENWRLGILVQALRHAIQIQAFRAETEIYRPGDENGLRAENDLRTLAEWRSDAYATDMLPYEFATLPWWQAHQHCQARVAVPADAYTELIRINPENQDLTSNPFNQARKLYAEAIWQLIVLQGPNEDEEAIELVIKQLDKIEAMQITPWAQAAAQMRKALRHPHLILTAYHISHLPAPEGSSVEERSRLDYLKKHFVDAAWEHIFSVAEGRKTVERHKLQEIQNTLLHTHLNFEQVEGTRLEVIYSLLPILIHDPDGPVVNGFYAYEIGVPRRLADNDYRRLTQLRRDYIHEAWEATLGALQSEEVLKLPASSRFIYRIYPDATTAEGNRLLAIQELLKFAQQPQDDPILYAFDIASYPIPTMLAMTDRVQIQAVKDDIVDRAWRYVLSAICGEEKPTLEESHIKSLIEKVAGAKIQGAQTSSHRLRVIKDMLPLIIDLKNDDNSTVGKAAAVQAFISPMPESLPKSDQDDLLQACTAPIEGAWNWVVEVVQNPFDWRPATVRSEAKRLPNHKPEFDGNGPTWAAMGFLLNTVADRLHDPQKHDWEASVKAVFRAFRAVNLVRKRSELYANKNKQLHHLSYGYLVQWKDSLPIHPPLWQRRSVNAQKRQIQNYWRVRQEYGRD